MAIDTQNDQQDTVANTPDPQTTQTPAQPTPATQTPAPTGQTQPSPQTTAPATSTPNAAATVTNAPAVHPAVQRASLVRDIAETLSGGPQYQTSIDPSTGATTRTQVPLSGRQLGLAIALEAISGSLAGLGARGPNHLGQAAQMGFQQGQQQIQARQAADQQQAQQEFQNRSTALVQKASIAHTNAQTVAAVSEAEQRGADAIDKLAAINRASGILDVSPDLLDNGGQPLTQAEFLAGLHSGKYNSTDTLGPVAGRTEVTDKDGRTHWESTHLALLDPNAKVDPHPRDVQDILGWWCSWLSESRLYYCNRADTSAHDRIGKRDARVPLPCGSAIGRPEIHIAGDTGRGQGSLGNRLYETGCCNCARALSILRLAQRG